ncbi:MAG: hypothetical protein AAF493_12000 [Pseudomonadota bacterium]
MNKISGLRHGPPMSNYSPGVYESMLAASDEATWAASEHQLCVKVA